jgi:hypothetical protein
MFHITLGARELLLMSVAACGLLIVVLSFLPWVKFSSLTFESSSTEGLSFTISGTETSRLRDLEVIDIDTVQEEHEWCSCRVDTGDGYVTAALGGLLALAAAAALATRRDRAAMPVAVIAALCTLFLAGYDALGKWQAFVWTDLGLTEAVDGSPTWQLWTIMAASAVAAVLARVVWTLAGLRDEEWDEDELPEDEELPEPA